MPAAHMTPKAIFPWLVTAALSAAAGPVCAGDWKSNSYFTGRAADVGLSLTAITPVSGRVTISADRDYGRLVLGGSYSRGGDLQHLGGAGSTATEQLRLRAGYDFGQSLGYISVGRQQPLGQGEQGQGDSLGLGLRVSLNRALQLTGEYLHHRPSSGATGRLQSPGRISIGAAFRF